jgi:uncharacterized protein HemY
MADLHGASDLPGYDLFLIIGSYIFMALLLFVIIMTIVWMFSWIFKAIKRTPDAILKVVRFRSPREKREKRWKTKKNQDENGD